MANASTGAKLYMPNNANQTTLNLMIDNLTPELLYVGVRGVEGTSTVYEKTVELSAFPSATSGSVSLGEATPIFIFGATQVNPIQIDKVFLSNLPASEIGTAEYIEYDTTTLTSAVQTEAYYEEDGTFVIDDIVIQMSINQNI